MLGIRAGQWSGHSNTGETDLHEQVLLLQRSDYRWSRTRFAVSGEGSHETLNQVLLGCAGCTGEGIIVPPGGVRLSVAAYVDSEAHAHQNPGGGFLYTVVKSLHLFRYLNSKWL